MKWSGKVGDTWNKHSSSSLWAFPVIQTYPFNWPINRKN